MALSLSLFPPCLPLAASLSLTPSRLPTGAPKVIMKQSMEMQREGWARLRVWEAAMKEANPFDLYLISNEGSVVTRHYWNHWKFVGLLFRSSFPDVLCTSAGTRGSCEREKCWMVKEKRTFYGCDFLYFWTTQFFFCILTTFSSKHETSIFILRNIQKEK